MAKILDGRVIAKEIREEVESRAAQFDKKPSLAIVLATGDESAKTYANTIKKTAERTGLNAELFELGEDTDQVRLAQKITELANDDNINGIILQAPVYAHISLEEIRSLIPPEKDIDGANPLSAGKLFSRQEAFAPATAQAVIETLKYYNIPSKGKHAVVVGRSLVVGKPVSNMLVDLDATVTVCHSKTEKLDYYTKSADILVVAAGKAGLIGKDFIDPAKNTVVIDVGTNFDEGGNMVGDVAFDEVEAISGSISPVPGGIGPVTTALLLKNTLKAYLNQNKPNTP